MNCNGLRITAIRKVIAIVCFMLCFAVLLSSCLDGQDEVSHGEQSSEVSNAQIVDDNSSHADISDESYTDESSDTPSKDDISEEQSADESLEESSEPVNRVQITYDMVNIFLKYTGLHCTIQEEMAQRSLTEDWFEKWYVSYGELNGYVLCRMQNFIANAAIWECAAGEYLFISGSNYYPSGIGLYLYKDETFIPFEDSEGLVDPADAYELINSYTGPAPYDSLEVVKLSELSEEKAEYCRKHQYWDFYPSK